MGQKTIVVGAGPVGALAALYAAQRGRDVEVYELRSGTFLHFHLFCSWLPYELLENSPNYYPSLLFEF